MPEHIIHIHSPGPRPPFYLIAEHLWGPGCDVASDGNSTTREDQSWTELNLLSRLSPPLRREICPVPVSPLILAVCSSQQSLCRMTSDFIVAYSGGTLQSV